MELRRLEDAPGKFSLRGNVSKQQRTQHGHICQTFYHLLIIEDLRTLRVQNSYGARWMERLP
jgi:hypothetical protein